MAAGMAILIGLSLFLITKFQLPQSKDLVMQQNKPPKELNDEMFSTAKDRVDSEAEMSDIALQNAPPGEAKQKRIRSNAEENSSSSLDAPKESTSEIEEAMIDETETAIEGEVESAPAAEINDALGLDQRETNPLVTIEGRVFDDVGQPLIGASVLQSDIGVGTHTDLEGRFILNTPDTNQDISISLAGFKSKVVSEGISPGKNLDIRLEEDAVLDEVVVTSLPRARKSQTTRKEPFRRDQKNLETTLKRILATLQLQKKLVSLVVWCCHLNSKLTAGLPKSRSLNL